MAYVALGTKAVGSIVKLNVGGAAKEFIVVHQGKPSSSYDDSCDGTWLLMKDIYNNRQWHSSNDNKYASSTIRSYLNSTFLALLDSDIQSRIKQVKIPYVNGNGNSGSTAYGSSGLSAKIFLLSCTEAQYASRDMRSEGSVLSYFASCPTAAPDNKRIAYLNGSAANWWLRSPNPGNATSALYGYINGHAGGDVCSSSYGVRPALVLPPALMVSDDGSIKTNTPPTTPGSITVPSSIMGGSTINVSWAASTDAENNLAGYKVEKSTDGGSTWGQIYQTSGTSTTDTVTFGTSSVMYRVKAFDSKGLESGYRTSPQRTVVNNNTPPDITSSTASGSNLGTKTAGFDFTYKVTDADGDTVTVKEYLDNALQRTYTATLGAANTFQCVTAANFQTIRNGAHTLKIVANDGKADSAAYTVTFTKKVTTAAITLSSPLEADDEIRVMVLNIAGSLPSDANLEVLVTNNAKDESPVWEDATADVKAGVNHVFTNKTAANGFAFNFKITVSRGASDAGGYISNIGGAFE